MAMDFNPDNFDTGNQAQLDESLLVKFFTKERPDSARTAMEGRPIFKTVEYIDIKIPGSNTGGACRPARANDITRFAKHYAAFKQRLEVPMEGTPLAEWPLIPRSLVEELAYFNVKTVEHLSTMADVHVSNIMGLSVFKQKAQEWLKIAKDQKSAADLKAELAIRDEQIEALQAQMAVLVAAETPGKKKTKPRKKKEPEVMDEAPATTKTDAPKTRRRRRAA
jgi:hypothetical protein